MAKRFIDTEIWDKEWFMNLPLKLKCLTRFIYDKCDQAGVWSPNWVLASSYIGEKVTIEDVRLISNQFEELPDGKIFVPGFIEFQYGKLSKDCKPHIPIYRLLSKHGIDVANIKMSETRGKSHNVSELTRQSIFKRDNYECAYCGKEKELRNLVIDHVVPRSKGGDDKATNLVACCAPCNSRKSDFTLLEFCERQNLDFQFISERVTQRVSGRVLITLQEKEKEKDKEEEEEKDKERLTAAIFSDERWTENLKMTHTGKDVIQAWNECFNHHSVSRSPPQAVWEWRQKLNTWLTIKPYAKKKTNQFEKGKFVA